METGGQIRARCTAHGGAEMALGGLERILLLQVFDAKGVTKATGARVVREFEVPGSSIRRAESPLKV